MLSGGSETASGSNQAPIKPWEVSGPELDSGNNSISNIFTPPPPPPPLPVSSPSEVVYPNNNSNWSGFGNSSSNYYGGGYNRFGYPTNYNTGYNSYSSPYFNNNGPFGGGPPAPGSFITSSLENSTRPLFDSLNHVLQAINHVACFVDSTVFAVWTSVTAAGSIVAAIKNIKNVHLHKWAETAREFIKKSKLILKTSSGRKRLLLLVSILASVPLFIKALQTILKMDDTDEKSLIVNNTDGLNTESSENSNDLASKALFVRAIYGHNPLDKNVYLNLRPGDVVLISKDDESKLSGSSPTWIAGKLKDGSSGYFPSNYVNVIK